MLAAAGNMWIAAGQPGKAALALDRALAGTGLQADQRGLALLDRARAAEAQGDLKAARRFVTQAAQSAAEDPFTWYFSAALAIREGDLPTARLAINRALALPPTIPTCCSRPAMSPKPRATRPRRANIGSARRRRPRRRDGGAARQALAMVDVPLTVTTSAPAAAGEGQEVTQIPPLDAARFRPEATIAFFKLLGLEERRRTRRARRAGSRSSSSAPATTRPRSS